MARQTDTPDTWTDPMKQIGSDMTARAATQVVEPSGIGVDEVDVVELHDCIRPIINNLK